MGALGEAAISFGAFGGKPIHSRLAPGGLSLTWWDRVGPLIHLTPKHARSPKHARY